ncbi:protein spaetzle 4 isoform X2 [Chelonus insularis]|nr:protein spaetzle 4 isoform X2 [Chelonus insularis]XP_034934573.1 protein spaetzle 4 isoform X2 [Chelonus insularis]
MAVQLVKCQFSGGGGPSTFGYDASSACTKPYSRVSRAHFEKLPCDFQRQNWCTVAGRFYPWQAVRRFVQENQGLMRRMYGDERHINVLTDELEKNDIDVEFDGGFQRYFNSPRSFLFNNDYKFDEDEFRRSRHEYQSRGFSNKLPKLRDLTKSYSEFSGISSTSPSSLSSSTPKSSLPSQTSTPLPFSDISATINRDVTTKLFQLNSSTELPLKNSSKTQEIPREKIRTTLPMTLSEIARVKNSSLSNEIPGYSEQKGNASNATSEPLGVKPIEESTLNPEEFPATSTPIKEQFDLTTEGLKDTSISELSQEAFRPRPEYSSTTKPESSGIGGQLFQDVVKDQTEQPVLKLRGINACPVKEEVVAPFWANNTRGELLALLNLYPFEQYVHWEKCTHEKKQMYCREGCRCEQQYRLHRLLAYDPNNECRGIFSDWFKFPSCCVCRCYDLPVEFRVTSRSPRAQRQKIKLRPPGDQ